MIKNLVIIGIFGILLTGCQEKPWYKKIEKFSPQEIESFDLSDEDDIAYRTDIIEIKPPFNEFPESAFRALLNTEIFADCCGPEPKLSVIYYHVLMNQAERKPIFLELLNRANRPGKIYALIALSEIDYNLFVEKIEPFLTDTTLVETYLTDLIDRENFNELLVSDWSKEYLLAGKTTIEWLENNPSDTRDTLHRDKINQLDVINGGWKQNFDYLKGYTKFYQK